MHSASGTRIAALASWSLFSLLACGGGGSGGTGASGPTDGLATIEGRVSGVATAAAPAGVGTSGGAQVSGIRVEARRAGQLLDAATTDVEGRFTLELTGAGIVELIFVTDEAVLRIEVNALPGSVVSLVVELRLIEREVVIIDEGLVGGRPIRCGNGRFRVFDEGLDLVIDGDGDDCVRVESNCVLDITVRSLTLVDCERCIDARSNAEIRVTTFPGGLVCRAREDGIRAASNALVVFEALDDVEIAASGGSGIRAESNARVVLASEGTCFIAADDQPIRIESHAVVDLDGCAEVVFVGDPDDDEVDDDEVSHGGTEKRRRHDQRTAQ